MKCRGSPQGWPTLAKLAEKSLLKPKQPLVVNVYGNSVDDHYPSSHRTPDPGTQDEKNQRAEDDKKHPRYQVSDEKRIAQSTDSEIVHEHRGPPRAVQRFMFSTRPPASLFPSQSDMRCSEWRQPGDRSPFQKNRLIRSSNQLGAEPFAVAPNHLSWTLGWFYVIKGQRDDEFFTFDKFFRTSDAKTRLAVIQELALEELFPCGKKNGPGMYLSVNSASFLRIAAGLFFN
jgi:hypothetical protein